VCKRARQERWRKRAGRVEEMVKKNDNISSLPFAGEESRHEVKSKWRRSGWTASSGCHMSLLDMDAAIISLAQKIELVYGPLVDAQEFPEDGVTLVGRRGSVRRTTSTSSRRFASAARLLISLGDCASPANVPALWRNSIPVQRLLQQVLRRRRASTTKSYRTDGVPALLKQARPLREFVKVDMCLPGCPPPAKAIFQRDRRALDGRKA